ncbi:MAG: DinB family protein [Gemmatimonadota bacterium]|jgi:uncharacterized damage-inducible protein DinB
MIPRLHASVARPAAVAAASLALLASTAAAQSATMADLLRDVGQVEQKLVGLARAMPADKYDWRPGEGVRSVGEVFQHVAADNYLLSAGAGMAAPAATGIRAEDYNTAVAYENRELGRDAIIAELEASFAHVRKAMMATTDSRLKESVSLFGGQMTVQALWVMEVGHIHEHLGQSIAYARSNGVVPPWSR